MCHHRPYPVSATTYEYIHGTIFPFPANTGRLLGCSVSVHAGPHRVLVQKHNPYHHHIRRKSYIYIKCKKRRKIIVHFISIHFVRMHTANQAGYGSAILDGTSKDMVGAASVRIDCVHTVKYAYETEASVVISTSTTHITPCKSS